MSEHTAEKVAPAVTLTATEKADLFNAACRAHSGPPTFVCRPCADAQDAVIERVISARIAAVAPLIRQAILDPGAFVKRGADYDGNAYGERLDKWQDRAVDAALSRVTSPGEWDDCGHHPEWSSKNECRHPGCVTSPEGSDA